MSSGGVQDSSTRRPWRTWGVWLVLLLIVASPWHYRNDIHPANEAARVYTAQAIAQYGTSNLEKIFDLYSPNWRKSGIPPILDVAKSKNAYVLDKAPGVSLLATPFVWLVGSLGLSPGFAELTWLLALILCGVPTLLLMHRLEKSMGASENETLIATAIVLASPLLAYAGMLFGHALSTAFIGLGSLLAIGDPTAHTPQKKQLKFLGGLLIGLAVLSDYTCGLIAIFVLLSLFRTENPARTLATVIAGGSIPFAILLTWNTLNFGDPFTLSYGFKADAGHAAIHAQGLYGVTWPSATRAWEIIFGAQRGMLFVAPWLIFSFAGAALSARSETISRAWRLMLPLTIFTFPIFVSGFVDWTAGLSMGPRHLMPLLPFMAIAICVLLRSKIFTENSAILGPAIIGLILSSALISIVGSYVFPYFDVETANPFFEVIVPVLLEAGSGKTLWSPILSPTLVLALAIFSALALLLNRSNRYWERKPLFAGGLVVLTMLIHILGAAQVQSANGKPMTTVLEARAFALEMMGHEAFAKRIRNALAPAPPNDRLIQ